MEKAAPSDHRRAHALRHVRVGSARAVPVHGARTPRHASIGAPDRARPHRAHEPGRRARAEAEVSGKPSPVGARRALSLIDEIAANNAVIEEHRASVAILRTAEDQRGRLQSELSELLRSMDVESEGNAGYGSRTGWLLAEMIRLARGGS